MPSPVAGGAGPPHQAHPPPDEALPGRVVPFQGGGAEDEPADEVGVPVVEQHGDRAAHRVAHDDGPLEPELVEQGGGVVGAVLEGEGRAGPQAAAVTPVVEGDDAVAAGQLGEDGEEVDVGAGRPPVEEQDGRAVDRRRAGVADEGFAAAREEDDATRRQGRRDRSAGLGGAEGAGEAAQAATLVPQGGIGGHGGGGHGRAG
jgi:hypothetical protein